MLKQLQSTLNWRGFVAIFGFFLIWYLACILELPGFAEMANPLEVIQMFLREYALDDHYWLSWVTSFQRVLYGFLFAQLFGIPLGLLFGTNEKFRNLFFPVFELLRPIPPLACSHRSPCNPSGQYLRCSVPLERFLGDSLGKKVSGVHLTAHLAKANALRRVAFLYP